MCFILPFVFLGYSISHSEINLLNLISPYKANGILSLVLLDRVIVGTWISGKTWQFYDVFVGVYGVSATTMSIVLSTVFLPNFKTQQWQKTQTHYNNITFFPAC